MGTKRATPVEEGGHYGVGPQVSARVPALGRCVGVEVLSGRTVVSVCLTEAAGSTAGVETEIILAGTPDPALARSVTAGFRRLAWVRIDASNPAVRCEVSGHARQPHRCRIPLAAALALAGDQVPTLVRLRPAGG